MKRVIALVVVMTLVIGMTACSEKMSVYEKYQSAYENSKAEDTAKFTAEIKMISGRSEEKFEYVMTGDGAMDGETAEYHFLIDFSFLETASNLDMYQDKDWVYYKSEYGNFKMKNEDNEVLASIFKDLIEEEQISSISEKENPDGSVVITMAMEIDKTRELLEETFGKMFGLNGVDITADFVMETRIEDNLITEEKQTAKTNIDGMDLEITVHVKTDYDSDVSVQLPDNLEEYEEANNPIQE